MRDHRTAWSIALLSLGAGALIAAADVHAQVTKEHWSDGTLLALVFVGAGGLIGAIIASGLPKRIPFRVVPLYVTKMWPAHQAYVLALQTQALHRAFIHARDGQDDGAESAAQTLFQLQIEPTIRLELQGRP